LPASRSPSSSPLSAVLASLVPDRSVSNAASYRARRRLAGRRATEPYRGHRAERVGKSSLLQVLAGSLEPDLGGVTLDPPSATVGYLAQEHDTPANSTVRQALTKRTGGEAAEIELSAAAAGLPHPARPESGAMSSPSRGSTTSVWPTLTPASKRSSMTWGSERRWPIVALLSVWRATGQGGLAGIELSRFDITLLDEPTNDLDFAGLARLEAWVRSRPGGMVIVSHDREFLARTVTTVLELDAHSRTATEFGGGWAATWPSGRPAPPCHRGLRSL